MPVLNKVFVACALFIGAIAAPPAVADPWAGPGDLVLRHDIQLLADSGVISSPVTTWPIPWATLAADLDGSTSAEGRSPDVVAALRRVKARMNRVRSSSGIQPNAKIGIRTDDFWLRTFEDTPREESEIRGGFSWMGDRFAARLQASYAPDPLPNDQEWRADGSYLAMRLGNQILSGGAVDRWWGPAWDNALTISSNARPIAGFTLERAVAKAFETKWLSWIGPWNYTLFWGFLGSDRVVPNARLLAFRVAFKPIESLEIGLTRTAMWCGSGRPCGADTVWDVILGRDNQGQADITEENEPGDQMAGWDARWASPIGNLPYAVYTSWIGEDEQDKMPSQWFGQVGLEIWGRNDAGWLAGAWRGHLEATNTLAEFWESDPAYNSVYNHGTYQTGHRFEGRAIGAAADGDSLVVSMGLTLVEEDGKSWNALLRWAEINQDSQGDGNNVFHSVAVEETERMGLQVSHRREIRYGGLNLGYLTLGAGVEQTDNNVTGDDSTDFQAFAQWTWDISGL